MCIIIKYGHELSITVSNVRLLKSIFNIFELK